MNKDELMHYGTPRHSGRYPWGSGENPYQRNARFIDQVRELKRQGVSEVAIAKSYGLSTKQLRDRISVADTEMKTYMRQEVRKLKEKGMSTSAIARRLGKRESSIRSYLNEERTERLNRTKQVADTLRDAVDEKKYIDIGKGTENYILDGKITQHKMNTAVNMLKDEGYVVIPIKQKQLGTGKETTIHVLCPPGTDEKEVRQNRDKIRLVSDDYYVEDRALEPKERPKAVSMDRIYIRYKEDGGIDKDGLIELRRGVDDISLKDAHYAQVRVNVEDKLYLKGMAAYGDDIPAGYDIVFNTNKAKGTPIEKVMKPLERNKDGEIEWSNPFKASYVEDDSELIRAQRHYIDKNGERQLSALNIVKEEGDVGDWSRTLSSQFLAKQPEALAKRQLDLSYGIAKDEFNEIMSLTNPTVKANLLNEFASSCDSDATHLKAAALPRQTSKFIIPFPNMKDNEVYAPGYHDGEHVILVRYPHAGPFEIPQLVVNNNVKEAKSVLGNSLDAVGINKKVADRLSGADFDGDFVLVIPADTIKFRTSNDSRMMKAFKKGLEDFDPGELYPKYDGMHVMTDGEKQKEMGIVSNLITDMTIKGAPPEDIVRAVRHSMVVIDAVKHEYDYKKSEIDNGIPELKRKYQYHYDPDTGTWHQGASTLLSRAKSEQIILDRKEKPFYKMTEEERERYKRGEVIWENTGNTYSKKFVNDKTGEVTWKKYPSMQKVPSMMLKDDAYELASKTPGGTTTKIESIYADYANDMKELARMAREEARKQVDIKRNPTAVQVYAAEVATLKSKLRDAERNAPLERQAQLIAGKKYASLVYNNPDWDDDHKRKVRGRVIDEARRSVGAKKTPVSFTDREWEAINAGAISPTVLKGLLLNAKPEEIKQRAMPRNSVGMSTGKIARAKSLLANGNKLEDVAEMLNVSTSTLTRALSPSKK